MSVQELIELYLKGESMRELSQKTGYSPYRIKQLLLKHNVKVRNRKEQNFFSNQKRAKKVNQNYFNKIDTNEKAWLLGFIAADGSIAYDCNRIKIGVSSVDREILEKIREELNIEKNIFDYETSNGFLVSEISWSSATHKNELGKLGISPRKTYKAMCVPNMDIDKQLSFILGYFDGDGCFRDDGTTCRFEICAYRKEILDSIAQILNKEFNANRYVLKEKSRLNMYTLTYSTKITTQILDRLYNLNKHLFLRRKFDKYVQWKKNNCLLE